MLKLSKLQIRALQVLCRSGATVSALATALGIGKSLASRIVKNLAQVNFINVQKQATEKHVRLSLSSGAEVFRNLYFSRPNAKIEEWLSGKAIEVLIAIAPRNQATINELLEECNCSKPTLYKVLNKLRAAGVLSKENHQLKITDSLVRDFAQAYATNIQYVITKNVHEFSDIYRIGKYCFIRTKEELVHPFYLTGISKLFELGLQGIATDYKDYYFSLDQNQVDISTEGAIVHALLLSKEHYETGKSLITIFLKQNRSNIALLKLNKLAKKYGVSEKLREIMVALDLHETLREYNE